VPAEVVDPAFLPQLSHEGVDPREACSAPFPALEPLFGLWRVDVVLAGCFPGCLVHFEGRCHGMKRQWELCIVWPYECPSAAWAPKYMSLNSNCPVRETGGDEA
jgi:hypothetical protein